MIFHVAQKDEFKTYICIRKKKKKFEATEGGMEGT